MYNFCTLIFIHKLHVFVFTWKPFHPKWSTGPQVRPSSKLNPIFNWLTRQPEKWCKETSCDAFTSRILTLETRRTYNKSTLLQSPPSVRSFNVRVQLYSCSCSCVTCISSSDNVSCVSRFPSPGALDIQAQGHGHGSHIYVYKYMCTRICIYVITM